MFECYILSLLAKEKAAALQCLKWLTCEIDAGTQTYFDGMAIYEPGCSLVNRRTYTLPVAVVPCLNECVHERIILVVV